MQSSTWSPMKIRFLTFFALITQFGPTLKHSLLKNAQRKMNWEAFVKHEKDPSNPSTIQRALNISYMLIFWKIFGHFGLKICKLQVANLAETVKGHIYQQDLSHEPITKSLWPSIQTFKSVQAHVSKTKAVFGYFDRIRPTSDGRIRPKMSKGTSKHRYL